MMAEVAVVETGETWARCCHAPMARVLSVAPVAFACLVAFAVFIASLAAAIDRYLWAPVSVSGTSSDGEANLSLKRPPTALDICTSLGPCRFTGCHQKKCNAMQSVLGGGMPLMLLSVPSWPFSLPPAVKYIVQLGSIDIKLMRKALVVKAEPSA